MARQKTNASENNAAQHLMFVSGYVHRLLRAEARQLNVRWTALMVLKNLHLLGAVNQRVLAEIEQVSAPTMTVLLQQMEERGWIVRESDAADVRATLVSLATAGRKELDRVGRQLQQRLEQELSDVPPAVMRSLGSDLGAVTALLMKKINPETKKGGS